MVHHALRLPHPALINDVESSLTSAHWGVGVNETCILLQVDDGTEQTRIRLTPEEALEMATALLENIRAINLTKAIETCK